MSFLRDLAALTGRLLLHSRRQPAFVIISIVQPLIWLLLFGHLFSGITSLPGFPTDSYMEYLAPGVAVMSALFGSAYSGMSLLMDSERGILDRLLVTPVSRGALIGAYVAQSGLIVMVQATVILITGLASGAAMSGGVPGFLAVLAAAFLIGSAFGALSNALALTVPRHDAIIAIMNFAILPLVFLSSMIIAKEAMPGWIQGATALNPVDWAVSMARNAYFGRDWDAVAADAGLLALLALACVWIAVRAFHRFMAKA